MTKHHMGYAECKAGRVIDLETVKAVGAMLLIAVTIFMTGFQPMA